MHKHVVPPDARHRSYRGRYRIGDNPKVHEVTLHTTVKEVANKLLDEIYEDSQRESVGIIPAAFTRKAKRRPLTELFEEYLEEVRKRDRTSDHVRIIKLRFLALAKDCRWTCMADVTRPSFIDWRNAQTKYEARTLNNYYEAARAFFNWVDRSYEIPNPLKRVETLTVPVKYPQGPRSFDREELGKLFAVAKPVRRLLYRLLAFSGLRRKEAQRLCWGDVHLDESPGLFLRPEATKARRADWLPILSILVPELRAARPEDWKANMLLFSRGVADVDTLHRDMVKAGIPLNDKLGRPAGIHTFRRTFITLLQKSGIHSRVIMQLARHKSLRLTDWTYTDTTKLPLAEGIETLAAVAASPRSSPRSSGQDGDSLSKPVRREKAGTKHFVTETAEAEDDCPALENVVQSSPNGELVPGVGVEPT